MKPVVKEEDFEGFVKGNPFDAIYYFHEQLTEEQLDYCAQVEPAACLAYARKFLNLELLVFCANAAPHNRFLALAEIADRGNEL